MTKGYPPAPLQVGRVYVVRPDEDQVGPVVISGMAAKAAGSRS
jgi:hypothetical protein